MSSLIRMPLSAFIANISKQGSAGPPSLLFGASEEVNKVSLDLNREVNRECVPFNLPH